MNEKPNFNNTSLLDLFCMEVRTQVAVMNDCLLAIESQPESAKELAALMRAAHSIKGAARMVRVEPVVVLAHAMEDCFTAVQSKTIALTQARIDILLQAVDMLLQITEAHVSHPDLQLDEDITLDSIVKAIANFSTAPSLSPPLPISPSPSPPLSSQTQGVRVGSHNLNRLMGLAGESLVEAKWLEPFANSLLQVALHQTELSNLLEKLQELLGNHCLERQVEEQVSAVRQKASECHRLLSERHSELDLFNQRSMNLTERLYRETIAIQMCPFAESGQGFPRMVRDLARQLGKQVKLEIHGKFTLVDRDILEYLEAPLTHLLRNAVDHGIESPQERLTLGKPEEGTIQIEVTHRAGMLFVTVSDDGRGINLEFLRREVVAKQLTNTEMAAQLSEVELMEFLFLPGFSTAKSVTEISGRGVGLDIVHSRLREVSGTIRAVSSPGKGLTFYLQLPLTLSVIRALLVEIAGEPYAFGLSRIDQVVTLSQSDILMSENHPFFLRNNRPIELISAHQVLGLSMSQKRQESLNAIVFDGYGLVVDRFLGERSLVVRSLDPRLGKIPNISAAALLDDGSPVLIVDIEDLVRSITKILSSGQASQVNQSTRQVVAKVYKRVIVVDDSITVREMERKLLENHGYKVEVAVNGIDAWNVIQSADCDLVITDIDMPRMNGFELTRQIKTHAKLKNLPVIIISYKDREEDRFQGLEAGADYYLTKSSFHDDTLIQAAIDLIGEA